MESHKYGKTKLRVTPIGLGLAALGRPAYINVGHSDDIRKTSVEAMRRQAFKVLDRAWDYGIRYFDVARGYGKAEEFLFGWLESRNISPTEVTVGSKWGYTYTANWKVKAKVHEVKEHSLAVLMRQWGESSYNLGRYLDLYQIHSATQASGVLENETVLDHLWELRENGVAIGLTVSGTDQPETIWQALEIRQGDTHLFSSVQATYNVLERSAEEALQAAHEAGWGVMIKEALANGRISPRGARKRKFADTYLPVIEHAGRLETSIDALAMRFVLEKPWVDIVLSGVSKARHLTSNLGALEIDWDEEASADLEGLAEDPADYWDTRSQLKWN